MDDKIEKRKEALEQKFRELKTTKIQLSGQAQAIIKSVKLIENEQILLQGAYKEICILLGKNVAEESKKNEERFQEENQKKNEEVLKPTKK